MIQAIQPYVLREAQSADVPHVVTLIEQLAVYEKLTHLLEITPEKLHRCLFGEKPVVEAMVAELPDGSLAGYALFFTNFSTFLCKPGLYLEDLFVLPEQRKLGIGKAMLRALAQLAVKRDCGRFEWSVLDWNEPAIRFYEKMGASVLPDWRICRMTGEALESFAAG